MAKAIKLKSGNWRCQAYVGKDENGKRIIKSFTAPTKKEAEYMAADYMVNHKEKTANEMTVGEAINKYIEIKSSVLSPSTIRGYRIIREHRLQTLMNIPLDKLTQEQVQKAINDECRRLSPKSVKSSHGLLTAALSVFCPEMRLRTTLPKVPKKFKDLPTPQEVLSVTKETEIELPVLLALWLGLRMSEIRGIRKKDIKDGYLTVQNTKIRVDKEEVVKTMTKTIDSTRRLKLPKEIQEKIDELNITDEEEYIINKTSSSIYKRFIRILEKNNLKYMTFHDLRHLNASVMLMLNIPDKYAMERGGWSTTSTLKSVYQHTFTTEREQVDNKIDSYFEEIVNTKFNTNKTKASK